MKIYQKPYLLACCGCMRLIGEDGTPQGKPGLLDTSADAQDFASKEEADEFARSHGWIAYRGNHRCPDCGLPAYEGPIGAYIDSLTGRVA